MKVDKRPKRMGRLCAGALAVLITTGWSGRALAGGPNFDLGQALQAMSEEEDWVFQTTWTWLDQENPVDNDGDTVIELSPTKADLFRFGGYDVPYGQFILQTGMPEEEDFIAYVFGFRNDTYGPWEFPPNTPMVLTVHYKADTETLDFWRDNEVLVADFRGNNYGPCSPDGIAFGARTPEECEHSPPHALEKVFLGGSTDAEEAQPPGTPPDANDRFDNLIIGLLDPATAAGAAAGKTAPSALLVDDRPGLNVPILPGEDVGTEFQSDLPKDWGAHNHTFNPSGWDTSDGTLTSTTPFDAIYFATSLKGGGDVATVFTFAGDDGRLGTPDDLHFRGDMNDDGSLDNLDITGFIAALAIGGNVADPQSNASFEAQVPGGKFKAGDQDRSNTVDNLDITPFIEGLTLAAGQAAGAAVPEPATAMLLATGVLLLARRRHPGAAVGGMGKRSPRSLPV